MDGKRLQFLLEILLEILREAALWKVVKLEVANWQTDLPTTCGVRERPDKF